MIAKSSRLNKCPAKWKDLRIIEWTLTFDIFDMSIQWINYRFKCSQLRRQNVCSLRNNKSTLRLHTDAC